MTACDVFRTRELRCSPNPADAKNIKCPVLVLHGADDPLVKDEEVIAFQNEMRKAKASS